MAAALIPVLVPLVTSMVAALPQLVELLHQQGALTDLQLASMRRDLAALNAQVQALRPANLPP